jgi:hypothetical protein
VGFSTLGCCLFVTLVVSARAKVGSGASVRAFGAVGGVTWQFPALVRTRSAVVLIAA